VNGLSVYRLFGGPRKEIGKKPMILHRMREVRMETGYMPIFIGSKGIWGMPLIGITGHHDPLSKRNACRKSGRN
jgi:hypothetical protein